MSSCQQVRRTINYKVRKISGDTVMNIASYISMSLFFDFDFIELATSDSSREASIPASVFYNLKEIGYVIFDIREHYAGQAETGNLKRKCSKSNVDNAKFMQKVRVVPVTSILNVGVMMKPEVSGLIRTIKDCVNQKKLFRCTFCNYQTPHSSTVKRHVEMKHLPQTVTLNCLQCTATFRQKQHLKAANAK